MTENRCNPRVSNPVAFIILLVGALAIIPIGGAIGANWLGTGTDVQDTAAMERAGQRAIALYCRDLLNAWIPRGYDEVPPPEQYNIVLRERAHQLGRVTEAFPECRPTLFLGEVIRHIQINAAYEQAAAPTPQENAS
jgi:hypothetical protein